MVNIFLLAHNRKEFTEVAVSALVMHTNFELVNRCVLADDRSVDGTGELCEFYAARHNKIEALHIESGTVQNALHDASAPFLGDDVDYAIKLDNDFVVPHRWLDVLHGLAENDDACDMYTLAVPRVGDDKVDDVWDPGVERKVVPEAHYSGVFMMEWEVFKLIRQLGIDRSAENFLAWSCTRVQRRVHDDLPDGGLLRPGDIQPRMAWFKIDKAATKRRYRNMGFLERYDIRREWVLEMIKRYREAGWARRTIKPGHEEQYTCRDPHRRESVHSLLKQAGVTADHLLSEYKRIRTND